MLRESFFKFSYHLFSSFIVDICYVLPESLIESEDFKNFIKIGGRCYNLKNGKEASEDTGELNEFKSVMYNRYAEYDNSNAYFRNSEIIFWKLQEVETCVYNLR